MYKLVSDPSRIVNCKICGEQFQQENLKGKIWATKNEQQILSNKTSTYVMGGFERSLQHA